MLTFTGNSQSYSIYGLNITIPNNGTFTLNQSGTYTLPAQASVALGTFSLPLPGGSTLTQQNISAIVSPTFSGTRLTLNPGTVSAKGVITLGAAISLTLGGQTVNVPASSTIFYETVNNQDYPTIKYSPQSFQWLSDNLFKRFSNPLEVSLIGVSGNDQGGYQFWMSKGITFGQGEQVEWVQIADTDFSGNHVHDLHLYPGTGVLPLLPANSQSAVSIDTTHYYFRGYGLVRIIPKGASSPLPCAWTISQRDLSAGSSYLVFEHADSVRINSDASNNQADKVLLQPGIPNSFSSIFPDGSVLPNYIRWMNAAGQWVTHTAPNWVASTASQLGSAAASAVSNAASTVAGWLHW